jgi:hypothetical protein
LEKLYAQRQRVQDTLEEKLGAIECESGNAEVQWKNTSIKECVLDTISDLVGKVEKRARKHTGINKYVSRRQKFKESRILTVTSMYVLEVLCFIKKI